jgi:hypothetical protein
MKADDMTPKLTVSYMVDPQVISAWLKKAAEDVDFAVS